MENQQLELHILQCRERLQQRLLQQQIVQERLKAIRANRRKFSLRVFWDVHVRMGRPAGGPTCWSSDVTTNTF